MPADDPRTPATLPLITDEPLRRARRLLHAVEAGGLSRRAIYDQRFPLGVFGTLRSRQCNAHLMAPAAGPWRAFLPNFVAIGIHLEYRPGSTAPFEVYDFPASSWLRDLAPIDDLEDFDPSARAGLAATGPYVRALAWLRLLPRDYRHPCFAADVDIPLVGGSREPRDVGIPPRHWHQYPAIPCWIYANAPSLVSAANDGIFLWH